MSKITLLVCAFACKQLTNIVSKGQPNDPRPRLPFGWGLFFLFLFSSVARQGYSCCNLNIIF